LFGWPGARARLAAAPWRAIGGVRFILEARRALAALGTLDQVIAHWIVPCAFPISLGTRAPVEVVAHGSDVELLVALPPAARRHVLGSLLAQGARFRFVSEALRARLAKVAPPELLSRSRVEACRFDVSNVPSRSAARRELGIAESTQLVVIVGRLILDKRVDTALRAALLLPRAEIVVVGDGPERPHLEQAFPEVRFVGRQPRPVALRWLAAADLLLTASLSEGAPTVVREARALGVPVVAAPASDLEAWSERDPGLYVVSRCSRRRPRGCIPRHRPG
jgi:glycosyltransferase involved in cell wall biosynthesis